MQEGLKIGDYVTWEHGGRAQCAAIDSFLANGKGVLVQVRDRTFELLYWDEITTVAPDLSGVKLDWSN